MAYRSFVFAIVGEADRSVRVLESDLRAGDLAKGGDDLLVVRLDERAGALQELLGAAGAEQHELETGGGPLQAVPSRGTRPDAEDLTQTPRGRQPARRPPP